MAKFGDSDLLKCSFCGKSQKQVKKLIAGPGVYICDECIDLCNEIIEEELSETTELKLDELPKPAEIYGFLDEYVVGQDLAKKVLPDHVLVEEPVYLGRLGKLVELQLGGLGKLLLDDLVAEIDALVADVHTGAGDELLDLLLALAAERALQQVTAVADTCHPATPSPGPPRGGLAGHVAGGERLAATGRTPG